MKIHITFFVRVVSFPCDLMQKMQSAHLTPHSVLVRQFLCYKPTPWLARISEIRLIKRFLFLIQYRGSLPYADFGTWIETVLRKICISGIVGVPYQRKNPPLVRT